MPGVLLALGLRCSEGFARSTGDVRQPGRLVSGGYPANLDAPNNLNTTRGGAPEARSSKTLTHIAGTTDWRRASSVQHVSSYV